MKIITPHASHDWFANELVTPIWFMAPHETGAGTVAGELITNSPTKGVMNFIDGGDARGVLDNAIGWMSVGLNSGAFPGYSNFGWAADTDTALIDALDWMKPGGVTLLSFRLSETDAAGGFQSSLMTAGGSGVGVPGYWLYFDAVDGSLLVGMRNGSLLTPFDTGVNEYASGEWHLVVIFDHANERILTSVDGAAVSEVDASSFMLDEWSGTSFTDNGIGLTLGAINTASTVGARTSNTNISLTGRVKDHVIMDLTSASLTDAQINDLVGLLAGSENGHLDYAVRKLLP